MNAEFQLAMKKLEGIHKQLESEKETKEGDYKPFGRRKKEEYAGLEGASQEDLDKLEKNKGLVLYALGEKVECKVPRHSLTDLYLRDEDSENHREVFQRGTVGLLNAIKNHDPKKGELSTYAPDWIRKEVNKFLNDEQQRRNSKSLNQQAAGPNVKKATGDNASEIHELIPYTPQPERPEFISDPDLLERLEKIFNHIKNERSFLLYVLGKGLKHNHKKIAEHLGISKNNVHNRIFRIDQALPYELRLSIKEEKTED